MKRLLLSVFLLLPIHTWADDATDDADYEETDDVCGVYLPDVDLNYSEEELEAALKAPDYAAKLAELLKTETDRGQALIDMLADGRFDDAAKILPLVKNVNFHDNETWLTPLLHCCGKGEYGEGDTFYEAPDNGDRQRPGQAEMVRKLLAAGADPNFPRVSGSELPFIKAARSGDVESMRLLLAAGANPHLADSEGKTALERAAADGQYFAVKFLLELPDMPPSEEVYVNPEAAVRLNLADSLKALLKEGLGPNAEFTNTWNQKKPLFFIAAHHSSTECLQLLIDAGADIKRIHEGYNALAEIDYNPAVSHDPFNTQAILLQAGLAQHIPSLQQAVHSALAWHIYECAIPLLSYGSCFGHDTEKDTDMLNMLVKEAYTPVQVEHLAALQKAGLNIQQCGADAVMHAAKNGFDDIFFYLLEQGAPLTDPNKALINLLSNRIMFLPDEEVERNKQGREKIVRYLVETRGADVNAKANNVNSMPSALMLAAKRNNYLVAYLLEHGANPLEVDAEDRDILHYLDARKTEPDTLRKLLEAGVNANTDYAQDFFIYAAVYSRTEIVRIMLEYGTDPNSIDYESNTAMHKAASNGNIAMVELLLRHGASLSLKNDSEETPLQVAQRWHPDNKKLLELLTPRQ